jgi:hypothetical protein
MRKRDLIKRLRAIAEATDTDLGFVRQGGNHEIWTIAGERIVIPRATPTSTTEPHRPSSQRPRRWPAMTREDGYRVEAVRSGAWWAITIPALSGVFSQARRLGHRP